MNKIDRLVILARQNEILKLKTEQNDYIDRRLEELERQLKELEKDDES